MDLAHILVPTDFSESSAHAERFASRLAARFGSRLSVLHAVQPGAPDPSPRDGVVTVHGDPGTEIVRAAHEPRAGLIVMPTHGYGTFRRFILGSVASKVLHDADCPVLTTTHHSDRPELGEAPFRHLLCAVDFGPASVAVLKTASEIARIDGARVAMVHVLPPPTLFGVPYYDPERWNARVGALLEKLQTESGVFAPWYVREGELAPSVNALAGEIGADLLVIGRHPGTGAAGRLHDQAYTLIRESAIPVLSV